MCSAARWKTNRFPGMQELIPLQGASKVSCRDWSPSAVSLSVRPSVPPQLAVPRAVALLMGSDGSVSRRKTPRCIEGRGARALRVQSSDGCQACDTHIKEKRKPQISFSKPCKMHFPCPQLWAWQLSRLSRALGTTGWTPRYRGLGTVLLQGQAGLGNRFPKKRLIQCVWR